MWDWLGDLGDGIVHGAEDVGDWAGNLWNDATGVTAARKASKQTQQGIDAGTAALKTQYGVDQSYLQPYLAAGQTGTNSLTSLLNAPGFGKTSEAYTQGFKQPGAFTPTAFKGVQDPGLAYAQSQALDAAQKSAAARGMLGSSNTVKTIQDNAGNIANKFYGDAFTRNLEENQQGQNLYSTNLGQFNQNRNFGLNSYQQDLGSFLDQNKQKTALSQLLAGIGQSAATSSADLGSKYGSNLVELLTGKGIAGAQGTLGASNANGGGLKTVLDGSKDIAALIAAL